MKVKNTSSAIYKITNDTNGKMYIGSSVNVFRRKDDHQSELRSKKHKNAHLQSAWNLYGEDNFTFEIIEYVFNLEDLLNREQYWMDHYKCYEKKYGYNMLRYAGNKNCDDKNAESYYSKKLAKLRNNKMIEKIDGKEVKIANMNKKIWSKISDDEILEIRIRVNKGDSIKQIAEDYHVSESLISNIKYGINRSNISPELIVEKVKRSKKIDTIVVLKIKDMLSKGISLDTISDATGESKLAIQKIKSNLSYINITDEKSENIKNAKLTRDTVVEIRDMISNGMKVMEISKILKIRYGTILKIKDGISYKNIV